MADHRTAIERAIKSREDKKEDYVLEERIARYDLRYIGSIRLKASRLIVDRGG